MLTLDDAIAHCKEKAEELRTEASWYTHPECKRVKAKIDECLECASEHEQLAEWLTELKARRERGIEPQLYIRDMQTGTIRPYGSNQHDALYLSLDGRTLSYENLQNGDGSRYGDYRLCNNPEGLLPEDMDMPEAVYTYVCIGGGYLGGA